MIKVREMEQCDKFDENEYCCWVQVTDVPDNFVQEAKEIDGEWYSNTCFGICVTCSDGEWYVCQDNIGCELYYIDFLGNTIWFNYILSDAEKESAIEYCKNYVKSEEN